MSGEAIKLIALRAHGFCAGALQRSNNRLSPGARRHHHHQEDNPQGIDFAF
ncbi:MAG TPA: hypothetical protein VG168_16895 [Bryobacteraceae bacterium]|jgi:hypothetical protein|nr:hypothetical protein [Bryobacteraceae bacterium]